MNARPLPPYRVTTDDAGGAGKKLHQRIGKGQVPLVVGEPLHDMDNAYPAGIRVYQLQCQPDRQAAPRGSQKTRDKCKTLIVFGLPAGQQARLDGLNQKAKGNRDTAGKTARQQAQQCQLGQGVETRQT